MKKPFIIFLVLIAAGIILIATFTEKKETVSDTPVRIPMKAEIVMPGLSTFDIMKTSDESKIPQLMQATTIVKTVTKKLLIIACPDATKLCSLQAIYDFVRTNFEYRTSTPEHNYIQTPGETLLQGSGDYLEIALLMASMQRAAGFENEILRGPYHTFVRVKNGNESIMMDPSCAGCRFLDVRVALSGDEDVYS